MRTSGTKRGRPSSYHPKKNQDHLPLVSIITVVFNGESVLEDTILSVAKQTYKNIEYIVIDGNSKDKTLDLIKKYSSSIDRWISENDDGIYHAMNLGASIAKGELIGFLNAGDFLFEKTISDLIHGYKHSHFDFSLGPAIIQNEKGDHIRTYHPNKNIHRQHGSIIPMPGAHMSVYMKKSLFNNIEGFDVSFDLSADYDLLLRAKDVANQIWFFDSPVGVFKTGGVSGSFRTHLDNYQVYKKHSMPLIKRTFLLFYFILRAFITKITPSYIHTKIKLFLNKI